MWLYTRIALRALKVSYSDVDEGGVWWGKEDLKETDLAYSAFFLWDQFLKFSFDERCIRAHVHIIYFDDHSVWLAPYNYQLSLRSESNKCSDMSMEA